MREPGKTFPPLNVPIFLGVLILGKRGLFEDENDTI